MNALGLREVAKQQADQTNRKESQPHRERVPVPELTRVANGLFSQRGKGAIKSQSVEAAS